MYSLEGLGKTAKEVYEHLQEFSKQQMSVRLFDKEVDAEILLKFQEFLITIIKEEHYEKQREGIRRKLKEKAAGCGAYGRPSTSLPADFEEQIRKCCSTSKPLIQYCRQINMKQSTFYRHAKRIIDNEKIESK